MISTIQKQHAELDNQIAIFFKLTSDFEMLNTQLTEIRTVLKLV